MERLLFNLEGKDCRIHIGRNILGSLGALACNYGIGQRFAIITNPRVRSLYGNKISQSLEGAGLEHEFFMIDDSETSKTLENAKRLFSELSAAGFDRESCIIGLGGGVVGDLAGFVAATYMRGIELIHIPTTLLAQIDSAIGGKTGLNLPEGKNLVGTFHQPALVISDIAALMTLPERDLKSGLAEAVKYGMACDAELFSILENNIEGIMQMDPDTLEQIVTRCIAIKARIVEEDVRDHGKRLVLNYGHTLGHALEAASGYTRYSHGEAVALGMIFAARVAVNSGMMDAKELGRLCTLITTFGLPARIEDAECEAILDFMEADKKGRDGKLRLVLPSGIGKAAITDGIDRETLRIILMEMVT